MIEISTGWWIAAGLAVIAELLTGTIYLLMLALGLAAGAAAAHLGLPLAGQITAAAVAGVLGVLLARRLRRSRAGRSSDHAELDIGEVVTVAEWQPDGTARVHYRGAQWTAVWQHGAPTGTGRFRVVALQGNRLVLGAA